uniref:Perforin-1-like n=1 Tax=Neolamprologus brichardi TaxID=32507 RepID=A0A3Q4MC57_NEOBR
MLSLLVNIWIYAGLLLSLPHCTFQSCTEGTPKQCADAEFAPGINLAGEGFDITKMERKGAFVLNMNVWKRKDKTCMLCTNPYLENIKQKLPLTVVDWRAKQSCSAKVSTKLHKSSESLVSSSTSSVENNWKTDLEVEINDKSGSVMLAGTNSKLAEYSMEKTKSDKFSFTSQSVSCEYYSYRVSNTPKLHTEFRKAVKDLPKYYAPEFKQRFYKLIDNFGTHYITKVKENIPLFCRFTDIKGGHTTDTDLLFSADKNPAAYKEWLETLPKNPDIISYSLNSLHELLPTTAKARKNLRSAISHYILEKGLWRNCSAGCQAGIKSDSRDSCVCQCHNDPAVTRDCCPARKGMARVIITVQRATDLWGDHTTATDGYVKVHFAGTVAQRTPVIYNNNNPHWAAVIDLGTQDVSSITKFRFEVWDEDSKWDDDLLGECEPLLTSGVTTDLCPLQHGQLFYKVEVQCAPSLTGKSCTEYKPTPINPSLKKLYVSRNAHPIPPALLSKMGVFVDKSSSWKNQSFARKSFKYGIK